MMYKETCYKAWTGVGPTHHEGVGEAADEAAGGDGGGDRQAQLLPIHKSRRDMAEEREGEAT